MVDTMKFKTIIPIDHLVSIKVWSVSENASNFNPREYRKRLTKDHLFLTDEIEVFNEDKSMLINSTIYLNEHSFTLFKHARDDVIKILTEIGIKNSDFWLGDLATKALADYLAMADDLESIHNEYKLCNPDTDSNRVYRFMQIDICPKLLDIGYPHGVYTYTWLPKYDGFLEIKIL